MRKLVLIFLALALNNVIAQTGRVVHFEFDPTSKGNLSLLHKKLYLPKFCDDSVAFYDATNGKILPLRNSSKNVTELFDNSVYFDPANYDKHDEIYLSYLERDIKGEVKEFQSTSIFNQYYTVIDITDFDDVSIFADTNRVVSNIKVWVTNQVKDTLFFTKALSVRHKSLIPFVDEVFVNNLSEIANNKGVVFYSPEGKTYFNCSELKYAKEEHSCIFKPVIILTAPNTPQKQMELLKLGNIDNRGYHVRSRFKYNVINPKDEIEQFVFDYDKEFIYEGSSEKYTMISSNFFDKTQSEMLKVLSVDTMYKDNFFEVLNLLNDTILIKKISDAATFEYKAVEVPFKKGDVDL